MGQMHNQLDWLFYRYWQNTCSDEERAAFLALAAKEENRAAINRLLKEAMEAEVDEPAMKPERADEIYHAIINE